MRVSRLVALLAVALAFPLFGVAQAVIPVGQFRSVELRNGGNVILRHGPVQRVTIVTGDLRSTQVRVAGGQRLVIDNSGREHRRGHKLQVEVITPGIGAVSVSNGGTLQTLGTFPGQTAIHAEVEQGGMIDIRSIAADAVEASVDSGGRILTNPRNTLAATVTSGGAITYWGDPRVEKSVRHGGVVVKGTPADAGKPLSELNPGLSPVPPVPRWRRFARTGTAACRRRNTSPGAREGA
ncbi:MAG TPA: DUF2807 domain-containing protein [Thermoanaerobaculia bacterium]|nr:DUF2807 domain-containing protein [Thermoanaerobaculia bacterium]